MGTARTSPKVVRERRAKGVQARRGKVLRHFNRTNRHDRHQEHVAAAAKVWNPSLIEKMVERLLLKSGVGEIARDDLRQELWVQLLDGVSEADLMDRLSHLRSAAYRQEKGSLVELSLSTPVGSEGWQTVTVADGISTDGRYFGKPLPPPLPTKVDRQDERATQRVAREVAGRLGVDASIYLNTPSGVRLLLWLARVERTGRVRRLYQSSLRHKRTYHSKIMAGEALPGRLGTRHSEETRERMAAIRAAWWVNVSRTPRGKCRRCGHEGPTEEFKRNKNCYQGVENLCKRCNCQLKREWKERQATA